MFKCKNKEEKIFLKICIYVLLTYAVGYMITRIIKYFPDIMKQVSLVASDLIRILSPLIYGIVIAYLVYPLTLKIRNLLFNSNINTKSKKCKLKKDKVETSIDKSIEKDINILRKKKPNTKKWKTGIAIVLTYLLIFAFLYIVVSITYSAIASKIACLKPHEVFDLMQSTFEKYEGKINEVTKNIKKLEVPKEMKQELLKTVSISKNVLGELTAACVMSIKAMTTNIVNFFIGLIIAFYIILDLEVFKNVWNKFLYLFISKRSIIKLNSFIREIDIVMASFIRGQLLDCFIVATLCIIALSAIGMEFAVALGIFAGLTNIIPYFGPVIGMVPAILVGLLSGDPTKALLSVVVLVIVQQIDCNFISPKIVGESVGVHPVFVIVGILVGAELFGILGMILAVPICGIIKILLNRIIKYKEVLELKKIKEEKN